MKSLIILICHYNNLSGLKASLESIQEEFDVDVMIVDDGSDKKPSFDELKKIYTEGEIYLELLEENVGVGKATNYGLSKILKMNKYKYTGRLDCGDTNFPGRFAKQLAYLYKHSDVWVLGAWANMVDLNGNVIYVLKHPIEYQQILKKIYINSTFINSATIYKVEILKQIGLFPEKYFRNGEDYAFYFNAVKKYKAANLPEVLLNYELNPNSLSTLGRRDQINARISIIKEHFHLGLYPIYGIIRNTILKYTPRELVLYFKMKLMKQ